MPGFFPTARESPKVQPLKDDLPLSSDLSWMHSAVRANPDPDWHGDLADDCTAHWAGFTLRAEWMDEDVWWWAVYWDDRDLQIASSNDVGVPPASGDEARASARRAVLSFLNLTEVT